LTCNRVSQHVGHGPLVDHGRIFNGPHPAIIEICRFFNLNIFIENVGSSSATNVIIRSLS